VVPSYLKSYPALGADVFSLVEVGFSLDAKLISVPDSPDLHSLETKAPAVDRKSGTKFSMS